MYIKRNSTYIRPRNDVFVGSDTALCLGASQNMSPANMRAVVIMPLRKNCKVKPLQTVTCFSSPQDHCVTRGYMEECSPTLNAAAGMSGNNRPFIVYSQRSAIAVLDRCGNNWKNGKGGCGPLLHKEYAPTVATMFQPFVLNFMGSKGNNCVSNDGTVPTLNSMHGNDVHVICMPRKQTKE